MKVMITAYAKVTLSKSVEMSEDDFQNYQILVDGTGLSNREIDLGIAKIADKYGFGYGDDIDDMEDPEEVTFERITD
jgi:hypothetical protein